MLQTKGIETITVDKSNTADTIGSGELQVFATPSMIALMEKTASQSVKNLLDEGCTTVGIKIDVSHISATPIGVKVRCESRVTFVCGKKITFEVKAFDDFGLIGEGTHERCIVNSNKFMSKAADKCAKDFT